MTPNRVLLLLAALLLPVVARAQEKYTIEPLKSGPPAALSGPIREALEDHGYQVLDGGGKPLAQIWLRKAVPASSQPGEPKETVLYPFLGEGELLGAVEFKAEGHDYRDQAIASGVYTLRYGLQPVNGDHLGVSPYRDFALLVPAAKDKATAPLPAKRLEEFSAEAAESSHPAVLMFLPAPSEGARDAASMARDEAKNLWSAVLPLKLAVKGQGESVPFRVQLVVVGAAMM